jgi:SAM-dependent methyltransferase
MELFQKIIAKLTLNSSRRHLSAFMQKAAASVKPGDYVLDAGAGDCFYKAFFKHSNYHSTDLAQNNRPISFISDVSSLPIANGKYDLILCTQVLEHVQEPDVVLNEFYRVLRPAGQLWLTAPLYFEEHEIPNDYFRFTQFGIRYLMKKAGFQVKQLEWLEGYLGTLSYEMIKTARMLPLHPRAYGHPIIGIPFSIVAFFMKPISLLIGIIFSCLDTRHKHTSSGHSKNYVVIAVKENDDPASM